ncbi:hypothetical protein ES703_119820 [subsurface metagenome]
MPASKSAQKRVRVTERKRLRNKPVRTLCKTNITKAERLIFLGELKAAEEAVAVAITSLDKAAEKGIIHPNNAARRKSRLMKKLNQLQVQAPAPAPAKAKPKAAKAKPKAAKAKAKAAKAKPKATKPKAKAAKVEPKKAEEEPPEKLDSEG